MKKYLIGLFIFVAAGVALLLLFNQELFTATDGVIEPADDVVNVGDDTIETVEEEDADAEEEVVADAPDEEAVDEGSESESDEGNGASDDAGFTITEFPYQDFIQARSKGEPIVLKFYAET